MLLTVIMEITVLRYFIILNVFGNLALDVCLGSCSKQNFNNVHMIVFAGPVKRGHIQL